LYNAGMTSEGVSKDYTNDGEIDFYDMRFLIDGL
jgi:hypothetical protein